MSVKFYTDIKLLDSSQIREAEINSNVMEPDEYEKLKDNILRFGFSDPIKVTKNGRGYVVVDGHHRLKALKELNARKVPCIVLEEREETKKSIAAINFNTLRGNQNPRELGKIIKQLVEQGHPLNELERIFVYSEPELMDRVDLLNLPEDAEDFIRRQKEAEEREISVVWSFLIPKSKCEMVEKALGMFGENKGEGFAELCARMVNNAQNRQS